MTLNAFGTFPLRYVEKILPISPYTLLTSGLSIDFELTYLSLSSSFLSHAYYPIFSSLRPKMFKIFISY
jgi:hypothetical protein